MKESENNGKLNELDKDETEDEELFDMFKNDPDEIEKINKDDLYANFNILECDDEEGYYKLRIGEILNSKFKIL